ncbi:GDSL esterase/lipase WDL1-like [Nicotiana tabacum]|uniref:GDSL esterase/lipase At2g38180-like n=2 Tax=Nicotiana TaxID=4085 RepID=A0A1S3ZBN1_TOBAC|nr:PREDICTED: GDSL esterase/lipase At2g38180-like [Nicotiana sylvestris]XP_016461816.1 PREDICTED: GDSL esterase/lipase At2g38180-like [Nicotiana tabacum]
MVGPIRPSFVLFGSSIVQISYYFQGWGATLNTLYSRKADITLRGYAGWNSKMALNIYEKVFPKDAEIQPDLVILYFGGNDSCHPDFPNSSHVPLEEYIENMRKIILHIKSLSEKTRLIMLSAPPVNEEQLIQHYGDNRGRDNETCHIYSEAGVKLGQELGVKVIDFWSALQERPDWLTTVFWDGMHLAKEGSDILVKKILKILKEADWEPSLNWEKMPDEFSDIGPDVMNFDLLKEHK